MLLARESFALLNSISPGLLFYSLVSMFLVKCLSMFVFPVEYSVNIQLETVAVGLKLLEY